ncbi:DUF58 domain-containing protein [Sulfitobacter sp. D35]|uniref:DUF58 domain-containing protein n=1 Tax=Sulfitobacter sp. D35 TaxID=3083252 RepID=UPI00296F247F|nr:DUF58 domain-containing protein [Sulfitobacter sp. D35]MDW4498648.1 DUF58 domain-containing protein [Sulfitobacter sp. D35]
MTGGDGIHLTSELLIAQRAALRASPARSQNVSALPGGFEIRKRGQGQAVADSRPYAPGDDMRHVDRGATARSGKLHVRTFHEERDRVSFLVADFRPSMLWGMRRALRSVAAAEALAWIGWQAVDAGGRVGLLAVTAQDSVIVGTRGGPRGMLAVIGGLVRAHATALSRAMQAGSDRQTLAPEPPLDAALAGLARIASRGAAVTLASALDTPGVGLEPLLGELAQGRAVRILRIEDAVLRDLPAGVYPLRGPDGRRRSARFRAPPAEPHQGTGFAGLETLPIDAGAPPGPALLRSGLQG